MAATTSLKVLTSSALLALTLALVLVCVSAADEDPLQDFCVAATGTGVFLNGLPCKDPAQVTPSDFFSNVLTTPSNTSNTLGSDVTLVNVGLFPGLNTQGLSIARLSFGAFGVNPPHNHPRASEVLTMLEGSLYVGFVTADGRNTLFATVVNPGEMFIFPRGLVHFQRNLGKKPAVALSALNSQNPGRTDAAKAILDTNPQIDDELIKRTLQIDQNELEDLRRRVSTT